MPKEYPRTARLNSQVQRELTEIIRNELTDPRLVGVTVTKVDVAPDLRNVRVYISQLALDPQPGGAVKVLNAAHARIRHALGKRLKLRLVPQPHFVADHAVAEGDRISGLIRQATAEDQRHAQERGEKEPPEPTQ